MIIVPLGIASATPTATRHLSSLAVWREGQVFLFDCGENTQMRMLQAGMKRSNIDYIFISHFDTDHFTGLIGLLATLQLQRREKPINLIGPKGLKSFVEFNLDFAGIDPVFTINYEEVEEGFDHQVVVDEEAYYVEARPLEHTTFCIGYRFQEKDKPGKVDAKKAQSEGISEDWQYKDLKAGKDVTLDDGTVVRSDDIVGPSRTGDSFAYIMDTRFCQNAVKLAKDTSILYHEATFGSTLQEKADETGHSTAEDAASVARQANTNLLVISHFSARYTNQFVLLREARKHFRSTWVATEMRPIMTDPKNEKDVIQPKVFLKEAYKQKDSKPRGGKFKKRPHSDKNGGKKRFKKKRNFRSRKGGPDKNNYRDSDKKREQDRPPRDRDQDREKRDKRGIKVYRRDKGKGDEGDNKSKPKPITPRTPFDDFDRF
mgnify:CR=1 FL=1